LERAARRRRRRVREGGESGGRDLLGVIELWDDLRRDMAEAGGRDPTALDVVLAIVEGALEVDVAHQALVVDSDAADQVIDLVWSEFDSEPLHRSIELRAGHQARVGGVEGSEGVEDVHALLLDGEADPLHHSEVLQEQVLVSEGEDPTHRDGLVPGDLHSPAAGSDVTPPGLSLLAGVGAEHTEEAHEGGVIEVHGAVHEAIGVDHGLVL
jgi:hypothetical protein